MQADYTPQAESDKQVQNALNNEFDPVSASALVPDHCARAFNKLYRAFAGIEAITRIVTASMIEDDMDEGQPLTPYLIGGLMSGMQALAEFSIDDIHKIQRRNEHALEEVSGGDDA